MDIGGLIVVIAAIFGILGGAAAVLGWLGFAPNGPHILAKIKERLGESRRRQRELEASVRELEGEMTRKVKGLLEAIKTLNGNQAEWNTAVARLRDENAKLVKRLDSMEQELASYREAAALPSDTAAGLGAAKRVVNTTLEGMRTSDTDQSVALPEPERRPLTNKQIAERLRAATGRTGGADTSGGGREN